MGLKRFSISRRSGCLSWRSAGPSGRSGWLCMAVLALLLCGCARTRNEDEASADEAVEVSDWETEASRWVDSVLNRMDAHERAAQLVMPSVYAKAGAPELVRLREYACSLRVGGIVLLKGNFAEARALADSMSAWSVTLPFVAIDGEWGLAMRLSDAPGFPANGRIAGNATENALYDYGYEMARESRAAGINMLLGPVLDVIGTERPGSGLSYRSFGSDARRVSRLGLAYARGVEDGNVVSVAKHFPGHGRATADSHRLLPVIEADRAAMDTTDLLPFRRYSEAGLSAIMTGHLAVPSLDASGKPATVSDSMLNGLLRRDLNFKGLIITDAMNMSAVKGYTPADAVRAGADIVLAPEDTRRAIAELSRLDSLVLADRCRRVLMRKYRLLGAVPTRAPLDSLAPRAHTVSAALQEPF